MKFPPKPDPRIIGMPLKLLPDYLTNAPLTKIINQMFKVPIEEGDFDFLENHCLKIHIADLEIEFFIHFDGERLKACSPRHFDVAFKGNATAFLLLATRREDPDTLFFQRKLMIEGDTELGLGTKNLLDSLELEQLLPENLQKLLLLGQQIQSKIPTP